MQAIRVDLSQPLLNADDVAALLSVPRSSVYEYARRQRDPLPSVAIGRHRRFIREDIEAWIATRRPSVAGAEPSTGGRSVPPTQSKRNRRRRR